MNRSDVPNDQAWLRPGAFVDSDHPAVVAFARETCAGLDDDAARATALFRAVRERLRYDPYTVSTDPDEARASTLLERERAWCVPKAVLLCAALRAMGIPARLGFADVKNHLASEKLVRRLGTDLFVWHGYVEMKIADRIVKASPAFNSALCAKFGVPVLELDGRNDAMLHAFDGEGRRHMEYVAERGTYDDLPHAEIFATFAALYGGPRSHEKERDDAFDG